MTNYTDKLESLSHSAFNAKYTLSEQKSKLSRLENNLKGTKIDSVDDQLRVMTNKDEINSLKAFIEQSEAEYQDLLIEISDILKEADITKDFVKSYLIQGNSYFDLKFVNGELSITTRYSQL